MDSKLYFTAHHEDWLCALMADDIETVKHIISNSSKQQNNMLLDGWISDADFWECRNSEDIDKHQITIVQRPWCLAAVCGSYRVVGELYKAGVNVFQTDKMGNNIIHSLIIHASRHQELLHLKMYDYIVALISHEKLTSLLLAENADGLRPVELAAYFHTLRLLDAILRTPGLYLSRKVRCATLFMHHYDVTDYESLQESRSKTRSLLFLLTFLQNHKLHDPYTKEMYTSGLIGHWIARRKKVFMPLILMWLFVRLVVGVLTLLPTILSVDTRHNVRTCGFQLEIPGTIRFLIFSLLVIITTVAMIYDLLDMFQFGRTNPHWMKRYVPIKGNLVVRYYFYRTFQLLSNLAILISSIDRIISYHRAPILPVFVDHFITFIGGWGCIWSILFFVQLSNTFGSYVIATQRMLLNLIRFSFIIFMFFLPSAIVFPRFISQDQNGACPVEFNSLRATFYTTFTVILNMVDFRAFNTPSTDGLLLFHVGFVIMVAILLQNFLIAIFSNSYDEVSSNKEVIHCIQWLSILTTIDNRIPTFLRPLLDKWKRRYFCYSNHRIYIKTFEMAKRQEI